MERRNADGTATTRAVVPVEYNQIQPLLQATSGGGVRGAGSAPAGVNDDVNLPSGYSPYPGNTNGILVALRPYLATLRRTDGQVDEFVNAKYVDESTRESFRTPTYAAADRTLWSERAAMAGHSVA